MKLADVVFVDLIEVELAHARSLSIFGGAGGLRDRGLLTSAVMAPSATWDGEPLYPTLADMAAAYAIGLARNHAFVDGNKRTAFVISLAFLDANGVTLTLGDEWIKVFEDVATGDVSRKELAAKLAAEMPNGDPIAIEP